VIRSTIKLALGTAQFGLPYGIANQRGQVSCEEAVAILDAARAEGLDTLDTAIAYGDSEATLGEAGVSGWRVVTKIPILPNDCTDIDDWLQNQVAESLQRLRINQLHGLLLHDPNQLSGSRGTALALALRSLQSTGLVTKIGLSIYSPSDLDTYYSVLKPDLVQAPLNLIDRQIVDSGWLHRLAEEGVEIHTRSAFLQGLLLMPEVPTRFSSWQALWDRWQCWLSVNPGRSVAACLSYPLSLPQVSRVVVGIDSLHQLMGLVVAMEGLPEVGELPDLCCNDQQLINPSLWDSL
jgi:aryl-alcohol dehydrogenase-like predicted oxidoreductase